jgi:hypothetical protein
MRLEIVNVVARDGIRGVLLVLVAALGLLQIERFGPQEHFDHRTILCHEPACM